MSDAQIKTAEVDPGSSGPDAGAGPGTLRPEVEATAATSRQEPAPVDEKKQDDLPAQDASTTADHDTYSTENEPWWKVHLFRGMIRDLRQRGPYYASDWIDAWDYRVVPATVYMFFAK